MKRFIALALLSASHSIPLQAHCNLATGYTLMPSFTRDCNFSAFLKMRLEDEKRLFTGSTDDYVCRDLKLEREYDRNIAPQVVACYQWAAKQDLQSCDFASLKDAGDKIDPSREQNSKWRFLRAGVGKEELDQREKSMNDARDAYLKALAPKLASCFTEANLKAISEEELEHLAWAFMISAQLKLIPGLSEGDAKIEKWRNRGDFHFTYRVKFNGIEVNGERDDSSDFKMKIAKY